MNSCLFQKSEFNSFLENADKIVTSFAVEEKLIQLAQKQKLKLSTNNRHLLNSSNHFLILDHEQEILENMLLLRFISIWINMKYK